MTLAGSIVAAFDTLDQRVDIGRPAEGKHIAAKSSPHQPATKGFRARSNRLDERLDLGGFDRVLPAFEEQAASMRRYRTNKYDHDPRIVGEITHRWRPFIDRYGYPIPAVT